jgi:hypothetical protein
MIGVLNRLPGVKCEVGTCFSDAVSTEFVTVIPGDPALKDEHHNIDIVLCRPHEEQFRRDGLAGVVTAYGDEVVRWESGGARCEL